MGNVLAQLEEFHFKLLTWPVDKARLNRRPRDM